MTKLKFFLDPVANTFSVWFKDPKEEVICDVDKDGNILSLDKDGAVFGFEKINFLPDDFVKSFKELKHPEKGHGVLLME
jgi:inosine/xanthosine triphosphate pyrophosphatase family protein